MVHAQADDAVLRWRTIVRFYTELAAEPGSTYLGPMIPLVEWMANQPWGPNLFPFTSHDALCVSRLPGNEAEGPFAAFVIRPDGQFECELWTRRNQRHSVHRCPLTNAKSATANAVQALAVLTGT